MDPFTDALIVATEFAEVVGPRAIAAGVAAEGAVGYGIYRAFKRQKVEDIQASTEVMTSYAKRCATRSTKSGSKKNMSKALIQKMLLASQQHCISRFQSLPDGGVFDSVLTGATCKLSYFHDTAQGRVYLPVYCFNMSAVPVNTNNYAGAVGLARIYPFYRLYKILATNQYRWQAWTGDNNEPSGANPSQLWQLEDTSCVVPAQIADYTVDWFSSRVLFKGATNRPNEIEMSNVYFPGKAGPSRAFTQGGNFREEDENPTGDDENEVTVFWDHYLASRTSHPLRTSYLAPNAVEKQMRRTAVKKILIAPVTEGNEVNELQAGVEYNSLPLLHCENNFVRMHKMINLRSDNVNVDVSASIIGSGNAPGFASNSSEYSCTVYQPRSHERWLMITAKTFARSSGAVIDNDPQSYLKYASFDFVMKQKILWNQDT